MATKPTEELNWIVEKKKKKINPTDKKGSTEEKKQMDK